MDHAVTIRDILLVLCFFGGLASTVIGFLMVFAGGMADAAPGARQAVNKGCLSLILGVLAVATSLWGLLR